jgi:hypothetical protein
MNTPSDCRCRSSSFVVRSECEAHETSATTVECFHGDSALHHQALTVRSLHPPSNAVQSSVSPRRTLRPGCCEGRGGEARGARLLDSHRRAHHGRDRLPGVQDHKRLRRYGSMSPSLSRYSHIASSTSYTRQSVCKSVTLLAHCVVHVIYSTECLQVCHATRTLRRPRHILDSMSASLSRYSHMRRLRHILDGMSASLSRYSYMRRPRHILGYRSHTCSYQVSVVMSNSLIKVHGLRI